MTPVLRRKIRQAVNRDPRQQVLSEVSVERDRQERKFPEQKLPNGTGSKEFAHLAEHCKRVVDAAAENDRLTWRHVLREEVYEAFAEENDDLLRDELIQVAAVAVRWIEALDRRVTVPAGSSL